MKRPLKSKIVNRQSTMVLAVLLLASWGMAGQPMSAERMAQLRNRGATTKPSSVVTKPAAYESVLDRPPLTTMPVIPMPTTLPTQAEWEAYREFAVKQWAERNVFLRRAFDHNRLFLQGVMEGKIDPNITNPTGLTTLSSTTTHPVPGLAGQVPVFAYKTAEIKRYYCDLYTKHARETEKGITKELAHEGAKTDPAWWAPRLNGPGSNNSTPWSVGRIGRLDAHDASLLKVYPTQTKIRVRLQTEGAPVEVVLEDIPTLYLLFQYDYTKRMANHRPRLSSEIIAYPLVEFDGRYGLLSHIIIDGAWYVYALEGDTSKLIRLPDDLPQFKEHTPTTLPAGSRAALSEVER